MILESSDFTSVINIITALITITNGSFVVFKLSKKQQIGRIVRIKVNNKSVTLKLICFPY